LAFSGKKANIMAKIVEKQELNSAVTLLKVDAPLIARKAKPGQFIIFRLDEHGERVPLTIADYDREQGTVTIIFQKVGLSTQLLAECGPGDEIQDFVGPLGMPTELGEVRRAAVIGGGVGCAIAYPQAKALHARGVEVDTIVGFRSQDIVILEKEFRRVSDHFYLMTDDGSCGEQGFVTQRLSELLAAGERYDVVVAIGPVPMMRAVSEVTRPYGIKTIVSLNPIMIDGTGMCGCCRVTVGGEMKFACVDGPDFDGHQVDYDELLSRNAIYRAQEAEHCERKSCRMEELARRVIPEKGGQ